MWNCKKNSLKHHTLTFRWWASTERNFESIWDGDFWKKSGLERLRKKENAYPLDLIEVTIDSKEPITLRKGKNETEDETFDYKSCSCFNLTGTYRNKNQSYPVSRYFDMISENRDHTSYAQISHIKKVFEHNKFKDIANTKKRMEVKFDNASHFIS